MAQDKKNQHYVPQGYLKFFSNGKETINAFDKINNKSFSPNIRNIASENYFYDLPYWFEKVLDQKVKQQSPQFLENIFSKIEGEAIEVLKDIICLIEKGNFKSFKEEEKVIIADFIFLQYSRTKQSRKDIGQLMQEVHRELGHSLIEKNFPIDEYPKEIYPTVSIAEDGIKDFHLASLFMSIADRNLRSELYKSFFPIILKNETQIPFITSDHPIVIFPHKKSPVGSISALYLEGNEIIYPISSKYLVIYLENNHFAKINLKGQIGKKKKYIISTDNKVHIDFYNFLQVKYSNRFVFSESSDFSIFQRILEKYPEELKEDNIRHEASSFVDKKTGKDYLLTRFIDRGIHEGKYLGKSYFKTYLSKL